MHLDLENKVALVTGGSRGIGRSVVQLLAREGAKVVFNYRAREDAADEVVRKVKELGSETLIFKADVAEKKDVDHMVKNVLEHFGRIDILVNNAGHSSEGGILKITEDGWNRMMEVHLNGTFYCTQAVIKGMIRQKCGKIVNVASIAGMGAHDDEEDYCTAKAGMIGFTKSLALQVAPHNINVNAVSPGVILTDMTTAERFNTKEKVQEFVETLAFKREPVAEDVAYVILFLVSDRARHITGVNINISGGQYV